MPTKADVLAELARRGVNISNLGQSATASKPTEDQAKSLTYARLMADAENNYSKAVSEGYNPGSIRNTAASIAEGLPFGGLDGLGTLIRDKPGDRARQAELQWSDAQLKALSGAAAPEVEVKRGVKTFFARPGEDFGDINPQKTNAREVAFSSARTRAGPLASQAGIYPNERGASVDNPIIQMAGQTDIPKGAFYRDPQGHVRRNENGIGPGNPIVRMKGQKPKASAQPQIQEDIVIDVFGKPVRR